MNIKYRGRNMEASEKSVELLRSMVDSFLERFTALSDDNNEIQILCLQDAHQTINVKNINDNHGIIGNINGGTLAVNNGTEKKASEQEMVLFNIFKKLNVAQQAQLLSYAAELEKEV